MDDMTQLTGTLAAIFIICCPFVVLLFAALIVAHTAYEGLISWLD